MSAFNLLKLVGIVDGLLVPVNKAVAAVLPDFIEQNLKDPEVRRQIVIAADKYLVKAYPEAKLIPEATRRKLLATALATLLDDILLPQDVA